jgi:hypothetical protein
MREIRLREKRRTVNFFLIFTLQNPLFNLFTLLTINLCVIRFDGFEQLNPYDQFHWLNELGGFG